jgi:hypothetical protein
LALILLRFSDGLLRRVALYQVEHTDTYLEFREIGK